MVFIGTHGGVDDEGGILHTRDVVGLGADGAVFLLYENAVAAVIASTHDEVSENGVFSVRRLAENDAAAGIRIGRDALAHGERRIGGVLRHGGVLPFIYRHFL